MTFIGKRGRVRHIFFFSSGRGVDKKGDKGGIDDERDKEKKGLRSKRCCWGGDGKKRKRLERLLQPGKEKEKEAVAGSNNKRLVKDLPNISSPKLYESLMLNCYLYFLGGNGEILYSGMLRASTKCLASGGELFSIAVL